MIVFQRLCGVGGEREDDAGLWLSLTAASPVVGGRRSWEEGAVGIVVILTAHHERGVCAGLNSRGGKLVCDSSFWILRSSREAISSFFFGIETTSNCRGWKGAGQEE